MRILIVEDETIASEYLANLLIQLEPDIEIAAVTESIAQTVRWFKGHTAPDLIFMDIHLSDGSAFSIFDLIEVPTPIIFTTAYDEYAINAFKVNSIDYLLKPIEAEELARSIGKFRHLTSQQKSEVVSQQKEVDMGGGFYKKLLISHKDNLIPVAVDQIAYFYTSDHQTTLCLRDGKRYPYNKTLDSIIRHLDPELFFRANKQFVIARDHVANITIWFDRRLLVTLDVETPERVYISKNKSTEFKEWLTGGKN